MNRLQLIFMWIGVLLISYVGLVAINRGSFYYHRNETAAVVIIVSLIALVTIALITSVRKQNNNAVPINYKKSAFRLAMVLSPISFLFFITVVQ